MFGGPFSLETHFEFSSGKISYILRCQLMISAMEKIGNKGWGHVLMILFGVAKVDLIKKEIFESGMRGSEE